MTAALSRGEMSRLLAEASIAALRAEPPYERIIALCKRAIAACEANESREVLQKRPVQT